MNNKTLQEMFWVFLPSVAKIISTKLGISLKKADELIYKSDIYTKLEADKGKMWYYSDEALAEFFINEYKTRELYGV